MPVGRIVYTQLLNRRGGIECDLTVTRVTGDRFLLITGTAVGQHDLGWLRRHLPGDRSVFINDLTSGRICFALWGPRAREILASVTRDDISDEGFPYLTAQAITVGSVPVYALRVTYVGELGWELYAHTEFGLALWQTLWGAGRPHGLVAAGYRAIDALRLEKGYRVWSSDITPDETRSRQVSGSRSGSTRRTSSGATRSLPRRRRVRGSACGVSCSTTHARSVSATSRSGSTARSPVG